MLRPASASIHSFSKSGRVVGGSRNTISGGGVLSTGVRHVPSSVQHSPGGGGKRSSVVMLKEVENKLYNGGSLRGGLGGDGSLKWGVGRNSFVGTLPARSITNVTLTDEAPDIDMQYYNASDVA